jgi:hypothetical protein
MNFETWKIASGVYSAEQLKDMVQIVQCFKEASNVGMPEAAGAEAED